MRRHVLVCIAVLFALCPAGAVSAEERVATDDQSGPIAELQAVGVLFECRRLHDSGNVDSREVTDPAEVEYIKLGRIEGALVDLPPLPDEVFDIFPRFPNLRAIRLEHFLVDPQKLRRLKEIPNLTWFSLHISWGKSNKSFNTPDDLDFLAELPNLEHLGLTSCDLRDDMIVKLLPLTSLKELQLSWNDKLTQAAIPILEKLPSLETLSMSYTSFAPPPMEARRFAARLKSFSYSAPILTRGQTFSLEDFQEIVTLPRHTWSHAHRTDVPLAAIVSLLPGPVTQVSASSWNREIKLGGIDEKGEKFSLCISRPLSDADLETVGQMTELRNLSIVKNKRDQVIFTRDGLRRLTGLGQLEDLTIASSLRLTGHAMAALSKMPSLRRVELRGIDFDVDSLAWVRSTPQLERLTLLDGLIRGDALADIVHARKLQSLTLGDRESSGADYSVSITRPTRPFAVDNIKQLTLVSSSLTVEGCQILGTFQSLESLTLTGPVTDVHLRCLSSLERLSWLTVKFTTQGVGVETVSAGKITQRGIEQLRYVKTPMYLHVPTSNYEIQQAMADQFGWRFYGCSSGCCDTVPMGGAEWTIDAGQLKPTEPESINHSEEEISRAIRLRGPRRLNRLVIGEQDLPPDADTLCLTDFHIDELRLNGWLPESIRIWGDSHVGQVVVSDVSDDVRTSLRYYFLDGVTTLTVPASERLSHVSVTECATLDSLRLDGFYPNLEQLELRGVNRLRYLSAPYRGDAPRLEYPADSHWGANLNSLRLLKVPGTAIGNKPVVLNKNAYSGETIVVPRFPPNVVEVDLRDTPIDDDWLAHLAKLRRLKVVRIGECKNLTEDAKAAFRAKRPNVELDEQTVHRPGASRSSAATGRPQVRHPFSGLSAIRTLASRENSSAMESRSR